MRYISKNNNEPQIITDHKTLRQNAGQVVSYSDFDHKSELNDLLRAEQRNICCYCMQVISHFQGNNQGGSHNEHFIPQNGPHGNTALEMDYTNIYACCNYSKDLPDELSYCGEHKHHGLITNFIQQHNCRSFFKYNSVGEVLPNGTYETEAEYLENQIGLPQNQQYALNTIKILNLNQSVLKKRRSDLIGQIFPIIANLSPQQAQVKIQRMVNLNPLPPFVEMNVYYLSQVQ